jgi:lysophospholipase L1-like esterase
MAGLNIEKVDPNLASPGAGDGLRWYDVRHLAIEGKGWNDTGLFFDRFPARAEKDIPPNVWALSLHSAGMAVRFETASPVIAARWTLRFDNLAMPHMPATGVSGLDLYVRDGGAWKWAATGVPRTRENNSQTLLADLEPGVNRAYRLYLPLYNGVESLEIGVPEKETLAKPAPAAGKPLCFYGTSITQGGCASRPGMAYTALAARRLDLAHLNLGFSGNGRMELAVAQLLAELDPCAYVLDAFPNMSDPLIRERLADFIRILRKARPETPILVMENIHYTGHTLLKSRKQDFISKNIAAREVCQALHREGVTRLTLVPGGILLGSDLEGTVDGVHPTDLGFIRMADAIAPFIEGLL